MLFRADIITQTGNKLDKHYGSSKDQKDLEIISNLNDRIIFESFYLVFGVSFGRTRWKYYFKEDVSANDNN